MPIVSIVLLYRTSTNCDLFTLDKPDFDVCLNFHQDFSTKLSQFATARYHAALQKHNQTNTATMNVQSNPSTSSFARRSDVEMEDIEFGILDDSPQPTTTVKKSKLIWKHTWFFTISHQSKFANTLTAVSLLLNATLSFIIPYQVSIYECLSVTVLLHLQVFYNEHYIIFRVIYIISELFYTAEVL